MPVFAPGIVLGYVTGLIAGSLSSPAATTPRGLVNMGEVLPKALAPAVPGAAVELGLEDVEPVGLEPVAGEAGAVSIWVAVDPSAGVTASEGADPAEEIAVDAAGVDPAGVPAADAAGVTVPGG